jgi:phosphatidylglycerophosphate synthase
MLHHVREHRSLLAAAEKRLLVRIARALPGWVTSDHLTVLAFAAMCAAGAGFVLARWDVRALALVVVALAVNWFGDSLDGTLARVRKAERPRYGFYVDHVVDIVGATALFAGLALSPFMSAPVALALLVLYLLVSGEIFLATAAHGTFRMSFAGIGPTELRILLAAGAVALVRDPRVDLGAAGVYPLFDVGGAVAIAGLCLALAGGVARNVRHLSRLEPRIQGRAA